MQFDSVVFLVFFLVVFVLYYLVARWHTVQNLFLLAASFVFYGWWDWRFLGLMILSSTWRSWRSSRTSSQARSSGPPISFRNSGGPVTSPPRPSGGRCGSSSTDYSSKASWPMARRPSWTPRSARDRRAGGR